MTNMYQLHILQAMMRQTAARAIQAGTCSRRETLHITYAVEQKPKLLAGIAVAVDHSECYTRCRTMYILRL